MKLFIPILSIFLFISCSLEEDPLFGEWEIIRVDLVLTSNNNEVIGPIDDIRKTHLFISEDSLIFYSNPSYKEIGYNHRISGSSIFYSADIFGETEATYEIKDDELHFTIPEEGEFARTYIYKKNYIPNEIKSLPDKTNIPWTSYIGVWIHEYVEDMHPTGQTKFNLGNDTIDILGDGYASDQYFMTDDMESYEFYDYQEGVLSLIPITKCMCGDYIAHYRILTRETSIEVGELER